MLINTMTMDDFADGLTRTRSVVIPFGSTEEHGPHLPLATDTLQAVDIATKLSQQRPLFVAPEIPYGVCRSSADHPGTLGVSTETLKGLAVDIVEALYRQGLRCFVLFSGHAGGTHLAALIDAGEALLKRHEDLQIAALNEFMLAGEAGRGIVETEGDAHAGEIETSRLMVTHPHLVRSDRVPPAEFPNFPAKGILVRDKRACWPGGVWGDPRKASREKGERLIALLVAELGKVVDDLERRLEAAGRG